MLSCLILNLTNNKIHQNESEQKSFKNEISAIRNFKTDYNSLTGFKRNINEDNYYAVFFKVLDLHFPKNMFFEFLVDETDVFESNFDFDSFNLNLLVSFFVYALKDPIISSKVIKIVTAVYLNLKSKRCYDRSLFSEFKIAFNLLFGMYYLGKNEIKTSEKILLENLETVFSTKNTRFYFMSVQILTAILEKKGEHDVVESVLKKARNLKNELHVLDYVVNDPYLIFPPKYPVFNELSQYDI